MNSRLRFNALTLLIVFASLFLAPLRSAAGQDLPDGVDANSPAAVEAAVNTGFTYQGQLRRNGAPYTGACAMQFRLYPVMTGGAQVGPTLSFSTVNVSSGVFAVTLKFGVGAFTGEPRWMLTSVKCGAETTYTNLTPRQAISVTPYALSLRPGVIISDTMAVDSFFVQKSGLNSTAIHGKATASGSIGVRGDAQNTAAVYGESQGGAAVRGRMAGSAGDGVQGSVSSATYAGVYGYNGVGAGIEGNSSGTGAGVLGKSYTVGGSGVQGITGQANSIGVYGQADNAGAIGVYGRSTANTAVYGLTSTGVGVWGQSTGSTAVYGNSGAGIGVWGISSTNGAVYGQSGLVGVTGEVSGGTAGRVAVRGDDKGADKSTGFAGYFVGRVAVNGRLLPYAAAIQMDHPLDPANKTLNQSVVESPDMMSIYSGNITTDANGDATVTLPAYFEALNGDYRYQLTVMGQFAQAIVAEKIANNQFKIKTDKPNVEVSWQVTGVRHDAYANANRIVVEQDKSALERGRYLYPEGFGQPAEMSVANVAAGPDQMQREAQPTIPSFFADLQAQQAPEPAVRLQEVQP